MNLPGSRRERDLLKSYAQMAPEMLRMSANPEMMHCFPAHLHGVHRPKEKPEKSQAQKHAESARAASLMWNGQDEEEDDDAAVINRLESARMRMQLVDGTTGGSKKRHQKADFVALGGSRKKSKAEGPADGDDGGGGVAGEGVDLGDIMEGAIFGDIFGM